MAIYYKFKSARDYDSIAMDGPFISVGTLKDKIFETKHLGSGKDFDLLVTNAQTNEEYLDEAMLIPKNTSVLIRRVPGRPRMPIVTGQETKIENKVEESLPDKSNFSVAENALKYPEDEWDEFGNDLYSIPEEHCVQPSNALPDAAPTNDQVDEDSKIKALVDTSALDWQKGADGFGPGRGYGRGMGGRMGGRGFGRLGMERKTPPQGYVCHRCNVPGHFIQHCPTNGDPNYDIKRVKPPTGIPKSMLMATPDGSYALPSGAVAVLKPNEDAFEKEMEGLPSTRSVGELPPELRCPLCKEVMKDAVLTSKCCFKSFCDKCIRDHIISKSMCVCGATDILADDLLPNKTLRDTINRILESGTSSAENAGSTIQVQDMESARCPPPKIPSPTSSAASKGEQRRPPSNNGALTSAATETVETRSAPRPPQEKIQTAKPVDAREATNESISVKEAASQGSVQVPEEEVQQQLASVEQGKKKKKKKARVPGNDMQWKPAPDLAAPDYMMPMGPSAFNPYWNGVQPGLDPFMHPYGAPMPPFIGYGMGPLDMPFGGVMHPDPFLAQGFGFPGLPPHRDLAELGMGMNVPRPVMSREEFEARKADLRRKRENERRGETGDFSRDREYGREANNSMNLSPMKSKSRPLPPPSTAEQHRERHRPERFSPERPPRELDPPPRPPKGRSSHQHHDERESHREKSRDRDYDYRERERERSRDRDYERGKRERSHDREREHDRYHSNHHRRSESSSKSMQEASPAEADKKGGSKSSVFSRISYPEGEAAASKKRKVSSSSASEAGGASSVNVHYHHSRKEASSVDYESSDEDRHFKRKPSRYDPSPTRADVEDEHPRHSKRLKGERSRG